LWYAGKEQWYYIIHLIISSVELSSMNIKCLSVFILLCFMMFGHVFAWANNYEGREISEVRFEGLVTNDAAEIRAVISTKKGSYLDLNTIDKDLKALYNLLLFEDISVDVTEAESGVVVTFVFVELPVVRAIKFNGNKKVKKRAIQDSILLKEDEVFRENELPIDVQNIKNLYTEKGRPESKVSYEVKEVTEKDKKSGETYRAVDVIFNIEESRKLIINSITFSGNKVVEDRPLLRIIQTKERGYWFNLGYFQESEFELDKDRIETYYADRGYVDARVIKTDLNSQMNEHTKREEMDITIYIEEGKQYTFAGVVISGNKIFTDEEIRAKITLNEGEVYNKTEWEKSVQGIRNLLTSNGYIYFAMDIDENKDTEKRTLSYSIDITENSKAHVQNIFITGNDKTKDFVIEREIVIKEGEIFNAGKIQRTTEKLYSLQYFSAINIDVKPGTELGLVDLIFDVEEGRTGLFSFGLTYSTSGRGISFYEEVSENNFLGRGLRLYEKVQVGFSQQIIEFGLDEPWLFNTPTSAGISFSWERTLYGKQRGDQVYTYDPTNNLPDGTNIPAGVTFTENPDGTYSLDFTDAVSMEYVNQVFRLALRLGRRLALYYGVGGELSFSVFQNYNGTGAIPFNEDLREQQQAGYPWNWKNYLKLNVYRDSRDIPYFAKRGSYLGQDIYLYGGLLGGYSNFIRLNTEINYNVQTFWKFVLSTRVNFGFIVPYPGRPITSDNITDLLRVDTWNEGRGWSQPSIQFPSLYSLRGKSEFNFSLEYRYPIAERYVWGLLFFDASGLYANAEDFSLDPKELWYSFGLGASLVVPGIPIRIYLARRFKYDYSVGKYVWANRQSFFQDWDFVFSVAGYF
jgi:outer membrane protein insertion porin family